MPSFTKKAIMESFLHLAAKKPLDKITVRDIVDDCGINRNTFYYYFQDIYAVLEELCRHATTHLPSEQPLAVTLASFCRTLSGFAASHPQASKSLALSLGFEGLERYFATDLDGVIMDCCARATSSIPSPVALKLLRHAILGLCLDILKDGKNAQSVADEVEEFLAPFPLSKPDIF